VIGLGVANGIHTSSTDVEPSESAPYTRVRWDTTVTWQISSSTQCSSVVGGQSQFA